MSTTKNFDQLTILIPTYNRFAYLQRVLKYYLSFMPTKNIIVLDSSTEELPEGEIREMLDRAVYKKFPGGMYPGAKIGEGAREIKTPYCALCADDDFILSGALSMCVGFLETHRDYGCAHGRVAGFFRAQESGGDVFRLTSVPQIFKSSSIEQNSALERLKDFFPYNFGGLPLYGVYRANIFCRVWEITTRTTNNDYYLFEILSSCLTLVLGKMKVLPVLYSLREASFYDAYGMDYTRNQFSQEKLAPIITALVEALQATESKEADNKIVGNLLDEYKKLRGLLRMSLPERIVYKMRIEASKIRCWSYLRWLEKETVVNKDFQTVRSAVLSAKVDAGLLERVQKTYLK